MMTGKTVLFQRVVPYLQTGKTATDAMGADR